MSAHEHFDNHVNKLWEVLNDIEANKNDEGSFKTSLEIFGQFLCDLTSGVLGTETRTYILRKMYGLYEPDGYERYEAIEKMWNDLVYENFSDLKSITYQDGHREVKVNYDKYDM